MNKAFIAAAILIITLSGCVNTDTQYVTEAGVNQASKLCEANGGIKVIGAHWNIDRSSAYSVRCNNEAHFDYRIAERIPHGGLAQ